MKGTDLFPGKYLKAADLGTAEPVVTIREVKMETIGQGEDAGDKGANKALTAAVKYILMKTFLIPTGEDADGDAPSAETPKPEPKPDPLAHRREMATNAAKALPEEDRASLKEWMAKSQMPFPEQMNASQLADFETQVQGFASDETF